jgi:hypothetical protein
MRMRGEDVNSVGQNWNGGVLSPGRRARKSEEKAQRASTILVK